MTEGTISLIVIGLFLLVLLAGFLFGLWRGLNKSLVRMLFVIASAVGAFFLAPVVTNWLINLDISNFGIDIGGVRMSNLGEILRTLLKDVPYIADLEGTTAFDTIMQVIPQMIANVVMFVLIFYIIRLVSLIIYWIIAGIAFSKKKTEGKNKLRLCGSLVGAVQGLLIFLVLLVPVAGTINILGEVETIITQESTESSSETTAASLGDSYNVLIAEEGEGEGEEEHEEPSAVETVLKKVNEVIAIYRNTWVGKFISGVKLDTVCDGVFTKLSTVTKDGEKYVLKDEARAAAHIVSDLQDLRKLGGFDFSKTEAIDILQKIIDHAYNSKLTENLINELVPKAAEAWTTLKDEEHPEEGYKTFFGISRPSIKGFDGVLTKLLEKFNAEENLHEVLNSTVSMVRSLMATANKLSGDTIDKLDAETIGDLLTELSENEDVLELAKDIIVTEIGNITETMFPAPEDPAAEDNNKVYRDVINEVVTQVIGHEYGEDEDIKNEIGVVTSALEVAQKLTDKDDEQEVTAEDIDKVIEALDNSTVLLGVLTATSTEPGHEGEQTSAITQEIQNQISKQDEAVQDQIEAWLLAATEGKENAAALYAIFFGNND